MQAADLQELRDDLSREIGRLEQMVKGLSELESRLVRNLYADELRVQPIQRLLNQLQESWPLLAADIARFQNWLTTVAAD